MGMMKTQMPELWKEMWIFLIYLSVYDFGSCTLKDIAIEANISFPYFLFLLYRLLIADVLQFGDIQSCLWNIANSAMWFLSFCGLDVFQLWGYTQLSLHYFDILHQLKYQQ